MVKQLCAAAVAACIAASAAVAGNVVVNGSTTVLPIVQKSLDVFPKLHPGVTLSLSGSGSGNGIKALQDGLTDIAMTSREIQPVEQQNAAKKGVHPVQTVIAVDAIVPIVNNANPVKSVTMATLKAVYEGKIRNWKELGGKDAPIVVISRDSSSGTFECWESLVMKKARVTPRALMQASNGTVVQAVAKNPNAIGYIGLGYVDAQTKDLEVEGMRVTPELALAKKWPLSRDLYFYTNGQPQGDVKALVDFTLSPEGQQLVKAAGYVPLKH